MRDEPDTAVRRASSAAALTQGVDARLAIALPAIRGSSAFRLDLHLQTSGGITVILGPSGSGKSLTLNCLAGFARPQEGRILVNDRLYFDSATDVFVPPQKRRCAYIFQDHALFPHMTVRENLRFAAALAVSPRYRSDARRRVNEILEEFELAGLAARKPPQLSGGQKQRAAIARALLTEPLLLLLDEPARGLDARLKQNLYSLLRGLRDRLGISILLVSHDIEECLELADSVVLLQSGAMLYCGTREAAIAKPPSLEIARALGIFNTAPAEIRALDPASHTSRVRIFDQELIGPYFPGHLLGDAGFLCFRYSELKLASASPVNHANRLTLRVDGCFPSAQGVRLLLQDDLVAFISQSEYNQYREGDRLTFELLPSALSFLAK